MFEISIPQIRNCIEELDRQEKEIETLVERMDAVCTNFDSLTGDGTDKRALLAILEEMRGEQRGYAQMREILSQILSCYSRTDARIAENAIGVQHVKNQFGAIDLSKVSQMLDTLNIRFK